MGNAAQMIEFETPAGYHYEWVKDESFDFGGDGRMCRMKGCHESAVARLWRKSKIGLKPWYYCVAHLYGRRIEGLEVQCRILVEDKEVPDERKS